MKVTPDEKAAWQKLAKQHGVTLSELIRWRLSDTPKPPAPRTVKRRPPPPVDPQLIRQIAAIGNNINQIARRCNSGDSFKVITELKSIEQQLEAILNAHKIHK
jgi:hypothetical protein